MKNYQYYEIEHLITILYIFSQTFYLLFKVSSKTPLDSISMSTPTATNNSGDHCVKYYCISYYHVHDASRVLMGLS